MLGGDKDGPSAANRKAYLRSVSWTDRSPTTRSSSRSQWNSKARACLPPLQPLSIARPRAEEWPTAGSDDLGIWPNPPTPGVKIGVAKSQDKLNLEQHPKEFEFKKDKLAFYDKECSRIMDHIYLGSDAVAKNRDVLRENGITHVLNCVGFVCPEYFKNDLMYKTLWLQDSPSEDITSILYDVFDYFEDVRELGGRVFVHCCQGVSRSTSLVIAYLMWKKGQNFEDAFQHVKAARGVTNPNMGFACQLLQCQRRVLAMPASPNSVLRMYRMAPHSPYDPLHLVPKLLGQPGDHALDSRGAFVVHVPSAIYVWIGKSCKTVISDTARAAAFQVVRYERARDLVVVIKEGEEPPEFWNAFGSDCLLADGCSKVETRHEEIAGGNNYVDVLQPDFVQRKVDEYDLDFDIFHKAVAGGVVPPFTLSGTGSETCLPARENGWGILRRKFASGIMKELLTPSKLNCDTIHPNLGEEKNMDICKETDCAVSSANLSPCRPQPDWPDSAFSFATNSPNRKNDNCNLVVQSFPLIDPLFSPTAPCSSPDSVSSFVINRSKLSSTSPSLSPATSDYSGSFTLSPSSSNWSDLSYLSAQPSPSGLGDLYRAKDTSMSENASLLCPGAFHSPEEPFTGNRGLRAAKAYLSSKVTSPSIAQRRGSNAPPPMVLPSVDDVSHVNTNLVRSWSFSTPDLKDDSMGNVGNYQSEEEVSFEMNREETMLDCADEFQSGIQDKNEYYTFHRP